MFFVYKGDLPTDLYIDKLSRLTGAQMTAAFNTRQEAVLYALAINDFGAVVVERNFVMQNGDDNNLISQCEWDDHNNIPEPEPEPSPEPELPEIKGSIEIKGFVFPAPRAGDILFAEVDVEGDSPLLLEWGITDNNNDIVMDNMPEFLVQQSYIGKPIFLKAYRSGYSGNIERRTNEVLEAEQLPMLEGEVEIDGDISVGEIITADVSRLSPSEQYDYTWYRTETATGDGGYEKISGAITKDYLLETEDQNKYIIVTVSALGYDGYAQSKAVGAVV